MMNYYNRLYNVYLLLIISHIESGLHGVVIGGSGVLLGRTGASQSGW